MFEIKYSLGARAEVVLSRKRQYKAYDKRSDQKL